jgi:hypothetical protein
MKPTARVALRRGALALSEFPMHSKVDRGSTHASSDTTSTDNAATNDASGSASSTSTRLVSTDRLAALARTAGNHVRTTFRDLRPGAGAAQRFVGRQALAFTRLGFTDTMPSAPAGMHGHKGTHARASVAAKSTAPVTSDPPATASHARAKNHTAPTSIIADVTPERRDEQYAAAAQLNQCFEAYLQAQGLEVIHNSGRNNNCAIYALLNHAAPHLDSGEQHRTAGEIRAKFDRTHPGERGRMLLLDAQQGGHGRELVSLVNQRFNVDMSVGVVQAGIEADHPATQIGVLEGNDRPAGRQPTHRVVVWDQHGHYEAITGAAPREPVAPGFAVASTPVAPSASRFAGLAALGSRRVSTVVATSATASAAAKSSAYELEPLSFGTDPGSWLDEIVGPGDDTASAVPKPSEDAISGKDRSATETTSPAKGTHPDFRVPPRAWQWGQAFDRSKPGFTAVEANGIRPFGNLFNAAAATSHGEAGTDLAITGVSVGAAHELVGGGLNGHALLASAAKKKRYGNQLDAMLAADVARFREKPLLETLILTRDSKGRFVYDTDKVMALATSENPKYPDEIAHAKNVFLTAYIRDEVAGKRQNRAIYEVGRNTLGLTSAALLMGATHGLAAAPASASALATKEAGLAIGFVNALDVGKGLRGMKQRLRDDKRREIDNNFLTRRLGLKPGDIPAGTPQEAIDGVHAAMTDGARVEADQKLFRRIFRGSLLNEKKATSVKGDKAELAATHALSVIDYHVSQFAARNEGGLEAFHREIHQPGATLRQKENALSSAIKNDLDLRTAYDLMRDIGMRRSEATVAIHNVATRKLELSLATDPARANGAATEEARKKAETADGKPDSSDVRALKGALQRR